MGSYNEKIKELENKLNKARLGGIHKIEAQHKKGKLTARERIEKLLDPGSFHELNQLVTSRAPGLEEVYGDAVVTGYGTIDDKTVFVYAQDATVLGGSLGEMHGKKISNIYDIAIKVGYPVIALIDSGGARIQDGVDSLAAAGEILYKNVVASGVIPQIAVILGPGAGAAAYSPVLQDFIIMVKGISYIFTTGPAVVKSVLGEDVTAEDLGGAMMHAEKSGTAHFVVDDEDEAFRLVRRLLSYLPSNNMEFPPKAISTGKYEIPQVMDYVPIDLDDMYDMHNVINTVVDENSLLEVQEHFGKSAIVGFARLNGWSVGIIANNPIYNNGMLNIESGDKVSRFIRFCDAFNIPIITFVDSPHPVAGKDEAEEGIIRHTAKVMYAYAEATIPKITVIIRRAIGGGYIAMGSKHLGADIVYAWPNAQVAVLEGKAVVKIIYRKELEKAENKDVEFKKLLKEYEEKFGNPYIAASRGYIDEVINPKDTRIKLIESLELLINKQSVNLVLNKKHGNIPL